MPSRSIPISSESRGLWMAVGFLLIAVLGPTFCILWFMNEAIGNERLAVRQRLEEVYNGELSLRQKRLDDRVTKIIEALDASDAQEPSQAFANLVGSGLVESAILRRNGQPAFPVPSAPGENASSSTQETQARSLEQAGQYPRALQAYEAMAEIADPAIQARALIGQARVLLHLDQQDQAIDLLTNELQQPEFADAPDSAGRLIAPDAMLLAFESLPAGDLRRAAISHRLGDRLRDYDGVPIASPQRLFLMRQLHQESGEDFPTIGPEALALRCWAFQWPMRLPGEPIAIRRAPGIGDTWMLANSSGQAIGIWTTAALARQLSDAIQSDAPAGTTISFFPTDKAGKNPKPFLVVPAGRALPDWSLSLSFQGTDPFVAASQRRQVVYTWMACLAVGFIVLLSLGLAEFLRRQMRLTRLKNDLIATVSHELKTPLASMRVLADTMIAGKISTPAHQREYLMLIARENLRLSRLIDNFLTFSRMERNKPSFRFDRQNVKEIVDRALEAMGERAAIVTTRVTPGLAVMGDADALATLLLNLLDNAWKYSGPNKEIELVAEKVSGPGEYGQVEISVRDNGIGIARRHHRRIFNRFYQVDRQLSRQAGGCGLGLAIVQFIAGAHRAKVDLASQPGKGSTFRVRLAACASYDESEDKNPHPIPLPEYKERGPESETSTPCPKPF